MAETILITGSNRGIGLQLCREYARAGWQVHACCRQPNEAEALKRLAETYPLISIHCLDTTNFQQIDALSKLLVDEKIDILFNNAGVYGPYDAHFGNTDTEQWIACLSVNTIAPMKVMEAFVNQVASSQHKIIATMSSKMGSMDDNGSGGSYIYRSSKAAVNAVMKSAAIDLKKKDIKVAVLHPGWVKTDMGGPHAEISTQQCVSGLKTILDNLTLDKSGQFFDIDGSQIPW